MSGINRYILSQHPDAKDIQKFFTPEAIASCNPEEATESKAYEAKEHSEHREVEGK